MFTVKVLYKNGFAVCELIFAVFIINTNTCLGFNIPFVILK